MEKNSKILITGSEGMVGKNLTNELKKEGFSNLLLPPRTQLDLMDRSKVFDFFKKNSPEYVFHLAARVGGIKANIDKPVEFLRDNLLINTNIIDACFEFKVTKLINLGSSCIYPRESKQPIKEEYFMTGKLEPTNEGYALSKVASLKLCEYYNKQYNTNFISLMPPNLYGRYEKYNEDTSHVLPALIMKFHKAKEENSPNIQVWGTGNARREFLYAEDLGRILLFSMKNLKVSDLFDNCFLNCGSGEEISIKELAEKIKKVVGYKGEIVFDKSKPDGMMKRLVDSSKFIKKGFKNFTKLEDGLVKAYEWYKERYTA